MKKTFWALITLAMTWAACKNDTSKSAQNESADEAQTQLFGAPVSAEGAVEMAELLRRIEGQDSVAIKVAGTVTEVCQAKGCWMSIAAPDGQEMRVTFKDYGFFVPKDLSGKKVVIEGIAKIEETPVEALRHYAEDAGKSPEEIAAITEPVKELAFEAVGVRVLGAKE